MLCLSQEMKGEQTKKEPVWTHTGKCGYSRIVAQSDIKDVEIPNILWLTTPSSEDKVPYVLTYLRDRIWVMSIGSSDMCKHKVLSSRSDSIRLNQHCFQIRRSRHTMSYAFGS